MKNAVFDIETDALLDGLTTCHCLAVRDCDTEKTEIFTGDRIKDGLKLLDSAETIFAHNGIGFDLVALDRLYKWKPKSKIRDTMVWSQFLFSDLKKNDAREYGEDDEYDIALGSHSLENWGKRLACPKSDYQGGWEAVNQEMLDYCKNDVLVTDMLRKHLQSQSRTNEAALDLEHHFAQIVSRMEQRGVYFDTTSAQKLFDNLQLELARLETEITSDIPPTITEMKTPQHYVVVWPDATTETFLTKGLADAERKRRGIKPKDCSISPGPMRQSVIPFNIGSRDQVRNLLFSRHAWVSPYLTESGEKLVGSMDAQELAKEYGKLSEEVLRDCPFPIGQKLADYYLLQKISSFLKGKNEDSGWLNLVKNGRIHHRCMSIGTATFRVATSRPNVGQTPHTVLDKATKKPLFGLAGRYGADCRSLYRVTPGMMFVGGDLSSIEAVLMASFLWPYDRGKFAHQVLHGDIHSANMNAILKHSGFNISRSDVKTAYYAYLYSAGDQKLGHILMSTTKEGMTEFVARREAYRRRPQSIKHKVWSVAIGKRRTATPDEASLIDIGSQVRYALEAGIEGLGELNSKLQEAAKKGYLNVLDRQVPIRSPRASLNTLLQSSAAMVAKKWVCLTDAYCLRDHIEWHPLMFIPDELDAEMKPEFAEPYSVLCRQAMKDAGEYYKIRVEISGEIKCGGSWLETH